MTAGLENAPVVATCLTEAARGAKWLYVEGPEPQGVRSPGGVYSWRDGWWGLECSAWAGWKTVGAAGDLEAYGGRFVQIAEVAP